MNSGCTQVTAAAEAIKRREDGQKRIAKLAVPLFGALMTVSAIVGCSLAPPSGVRLWVMVLSGIFYVMSYSTLICGQWTVGMIPQAGVAAYFFLLASLASAAWSGSPDWLRVVMLIVFGAAGAVVLFVLVTLIIMLLGSFSPRRRGEYTLMVLGCKLKDGKPGRMLRRRLKKAVSELEMNNSLACVVSGGRAPDQSLAEAEAMAEYLLENGISRERIIVEALSSTTYENFLFSEKMLAERKLPQRVGVVTDRFHQFRSGRIARSAGIDSFPISCRTAWYLAMQFWMRDVLCIAERIIRGHW